MTTLLAGEGRRVLGVDRSRPYLERARARALPHADFVTGDLEGLGDLGRFDHVVLANVAHELGDPVAVLSHVARSLTAEGALVHVSLPNPRSLHRLVAMEMGLIDRLDVLAERNVRFGTRRHYAAGEVLALAAASGLELAAREGVFLKPLPNDAMAALPADVLDGFERAARHLPEHGAMNLFAFRHAR
jgi:SAM-dependent methyltransferase